MKIIEALLKEKIIAVVRADTPEKAYQLSKAIIEGGIKAIEVTFTVPDAEQVIERLSRDYDDAVLIGAGTVLDLSTCKKAINHGARYIVSPGFDQPCADYCYEKKIPYLPGCMTVTEMMTALNHHVSIIKLFPGEHFGPKFIKNIKAPLPHLKVMVTGGVDLDNLKEWFDYGTDVIGVGSALTKQQDPNDYRSVKEAAMKYKDALKDVL